MKKTERKMRKWSIQMLIAVSFTVLTIVGMAFLGVSIYSLFENRMEKQSAENTEQLLNQAGINLETYLRNMRLISDAMYYSVIKETDLEQADVSAIAEEMNILYDANKDNLVSIACYWSNGDLLAAAPLNTAKENANVTSQKWFTDAVGEVENFHFSTPHVENLFVNSSYRYYWVVSLSRAVEITKNGKTNMGVLVIDMNYSYIEQTFDKINQGISSGYTYLCSKDGNIIYHPKLSLINAGLFEENNEAAIKYSDGTVTETFKGEDRLVTVKTISYTGWKIVSVTPKSTIAMSMYDTRYFVIMLVSITILALILLNQLVSGWISRPLLSLTDSIEKLDNENLSSEYIFVGGTNEVQCLGDTLKGMVDRLRVLMDDIVIEQEEKRKSELDALQSQINPHFLYNTLDSIVWMIEGEKYRDAIFMITQLASLFRISLSKGKTIISIADELKHAENYLNIQKVRYKNNFEVEYDIEEAVLTGSTVKLVVQPILENAIYYATESMDGEGEISIKASKRLNDVFIQISDNGMGMTKEVVDQLLTDNNRVQKKGSGVGLINVHKRIQLRFGKQYGLMIESEPDEGTTVIIHLPYIEYDGGKANE